MYIVWLEWSPVKNESLILPKLCHQRTATSLNTSRHVTLVEVRKSPYKAIRKWLTTPRIHMWLLGVCRDCCCYLGKGCVGYRRTVLQSGSEAA